MVKSALITGITGQDGAYLGLLLLEKGYKVYGTYHRRAIDSWRLKQLNIQNNVIGVPLDLLNFQEIVKKIELIAPHEIYNFAAYSSLSSASAEPLATAEINGLGPVKLLEAIRLVNPTARIFQASSAEIFGATTAVPQTETTAFNPHNPYGIAKLFAHTMLKDYRKNNGLHVSNGIMFNHESPLRGSEFVTRKITKGLAEIKHHTKDFIELGNLDSARDWGFAGDYVKAAYLMLQQPEADDYILATGKTHTIRQFIEYASEMAGFKIQWDGKYEHEVGIDKYTGKTIIKVNPNFYQALETNQRVGQYTKAHQKLGWEHTVCFIELIRMMVEADLRNFQAPRKYY